MGWLIDLAKEAGPEPMPAAGATPETSDPAVLWWRVSITEEGGRTVEVDTPSGWTLGEWAAYAQRYHGPGCAVTPIAGLPTARAPVPLDEVLASACEGVAGISPEVFRSLLSPEDAADIEHGAIHSKTLHAYAESFADGMRSGRIGVREGAKPDPASGIFIVEAEIEAARKGRLEVKG